VRRFKAVHTRELEVNRREGGMIIYHGFMLKLNLDSDGSLHSVDGEATTRKYNI
jgi:hypothetical protein